MGGAVDPRVPVAPRPRYTRGMVSAPNERPGRAPEPFPGRTATDARAWLELPDASALRDRLEWLARAAEFPGDPRFAPAVAAAAPAVAAAAPALAGAFPAFARRGSTTHGASTRSRPGVASAHGPEHDVAGSAEVDPAASRPSPPVEARLRVRPSPTSAGDRLPGRW